MQNIHLFEGDIEGIAGNEQSVFHDPITNDGSYAHVFSLPVSIFS